MIFTDALALAMRGQRVELDSMYGVHTMEYDENAGHLHVEFGDHQRHAPLEFGIGITRDMYESAEWRESGEENTTP